MSRATVRAFYMLLGGEAGTPVPSDFYITHAGSVYRNHLGEPYTKPPAPTPALDFYTTAAGDPYFDHAGSAYHRPIS